VKLFGYWDKRNNTYIVCEFMEGGSLYSYLEDKTQAINWQQATRLIKDIVNGMIYLHDRNILHLDLKSLNILLSRNKDLAKITDFGLSKISTITSMTAAASTKTVIGSTRWMAPEISQGKPSSRKSDVWSFGCILIEFATRELPFNNMTDSNVFLMLQNDKSDLPIVFDLDKTPPKIAALISNCLKRNKDERHGFESISEKFLDNLSGSELRKNLEHQNNIDKSKKTVIRTLTDLNTKLAENSEMKSQIKNLENQVKELKLENEKQAQRQASARNNYQEQPCSFNIRPPCYDMTPCQSPIMQPPCFSNARPTSSLLGDFEQNSLRRFTNDNSLSGFINLGGHSPIMAQATPITNARSSPGSYTGMTYISRGSANGSEILRGTRGGLYRETASGNRVYLKK
jgi:serine/threonine protein kinase